MNLLALLHVEIPFKALVLAALPPLSANTREAQAQVIFVGTIEKLEHRELQVPDGTDTLYVAHLKIAKVEKSLLPTGEKMTEVHFRRTHQRPPGWAGPGGQYSVPPVNQTIRIFG